MREKINKESSYDKKIELIRTPLLSFIAKRIYNHQDCQDILQEVLIILFKKKLEYNSQKSFYSWAFAICHFQIKKYLTQKKRSRFLDCDFSKKEWCNVCCSKNFIKSSDLKDFFNFCIVNNKSFFTDREFEVAKLLRLDYKQVEISKELNIQTAHVSFYKKRILKKVQQIIKSYEKV